MPVTFVTYLTQINDALAHSSGQNLAFLLRPTSPHGKDLVKEFKNPTRATLEYYRGTIQEPWDEIAIQYVLTCSHVARRRSTEAFKEHTQLVSQFYNFFGQNPGWTLPVLFSILRDLRDLAFDADIHAKYNGLKSDSMEESARIIMKAFTLCLQDRTSPPEQSRKWGVYYVVGLVLKCYFRIRRISLSKNILRALDANRDIPDLSVYPKSHQVTFRYYLGMLRFLNEEYAMAEEELTQAFYQCHIEAQANQERILVYLLPLRILKGHLPSDELLQRFPLTRELFTPFVTAIRNGDIAAFDRALENSESKLVELNLLLTVEKAREVCLRGLFRRVWIASEKNSRIPISMFHASLRISGIDVEAEEAECLVANQIYKGFIRGYISHEKQMVVLANTNAFPRPIDRPSPFNFL
ncbi:cop9 signalosome complex subunit 12 [Moniliophthora roreri MCA 2997]|uniref:Cop9 signalosome complex subunit 12 n=1 Tax=Moniliophthora roreri (strain MCA 2997) TaxID=1381753 RepID=V2X978_MONRO|nr:cop9 signalosome complex subunit 12 [Moniliophthora roreri MCA 2997]